MIQQRAKVSQPHRCKTMDFKKRPKTTCKDLDKLGMKEANEEIHALCEAIDYGDYLLRDSQHYLSGDYPSVSSLSPRKLR